VQFELTLTRNDLGETGSNQSGIHVPRVLATKLPALEESKHLPSCDITAIVRDGGSESRYELRYIHYNGRSFTPPLSTREEYRLTGTTQMLHALGVQPGDSIRFEGGPYEWVVKVSRPNEVPNGIEIDHGMHKPSSQKVSLRASARLIQALGRELVSEPEAAIAEIVKNSYDADANNVVVRLIGSPGPESMQLEAIEISDDGHGMSQSTFVSKWLVPATPAKAKLAMSPRGRKFQGKKGVGRFAVASLGRCLKIQTVENEIQTEALIDWDVFGDDCYLDEIELEIQERRLPNAPNGTRLYISELSDSVVSAGAQYIERLERELSRLVAPQLGSMIGASADSVDQFDIRIEFLDRSSGEFIVSHSVQAPPLVDHYQYAIRALIGPDGESEVECEARTGEGITRKAVLLDREPTGCGELTIEIRAFDRDPNTIGRLAADLSQENGRTLGRREIRRLLNQVNGVALYRGGFRIRPYGDPDVDWLNLNARRVQNPTLRFGLNQVVGTILVQDEVASGLVEKSARDGLKENEAYERLTQIVYRVLQKLEEFRRDLRFRTGAVSSRTRTMAELPTSSEIQELIRPVLLKAKVPRDIADAVDAIVAESVISDADKSVLVGRTLETERLAVLGQLVASVIHDIRNIFAPIREGVENVLSITKSANKFLPVEDAEELESCRKSVFAGFEKFTDYLRRVEPLALGRRGPVAVFDLAQAVHDCFLVIFGTSRMPQLVVSYIPSQFSPALVGHREDFNAIMLNLFSNSQYWVGTLGIVPRIEVRFFSDHQGKFQRLVVRDNGPGIADEDIESGHLFAPGVSRKESGHSGLGLTIAREAAHRLGLHLAHVPDPDGAAFELIHPVLEGMEQ
jgi:signal transduction histidine kinase